jgi:hypothetical protein
MNHPVVQLDQWGTRAQRGFLYQHKCAALRILRGMISEELKCIYVELSTDYVVENTEGEIEYVAVKSRDANTNRTSSWTISQLLSEGVLTDLYRAWDKGGRKGTVTLQSNADIVGLPKYKEATKKQIEKFVSDVSKALSISSSDAELFYSVFCVPKTPMPRENEIDAVLRDQVRDFLNSKNVECSDTSISRAIESVVHLISDRASQNYDPIYHATARMEEDRYSADLIEQRTISVDDIDVQIRRSIESEDQFLYEITSLVGSHNIVGRENELTSLLRWWEGSSKRCMVIAGPIGIGKTYTALEMASRIKRNNKDNNTRIYVESIEEDTSNTMVIELLGKARAFLTQNDLIIFDGVNREKTIEVILTYNLPCKVLITTVCIEPGTCYPVEEIRLKELECEAARSLVADRLDDNDAGKELVELLGGNPMSLVQATTYCKVAGLSPEDYCNQVRRTGIDSVLKQGGSLDPMYAYGASDKPRVPIAMSFKSLLGKIPEIDLHVLRLVALCGSGPVNQVFLVRGIKMDSEGNDAGLRASLEDESEMIGAIYRLVRQSFIDKHGEDLMIQNVYRELIVVDIDEVEPYCEYLLRLLTENYRSLRGLREADRLIHNLHGMNYSGQDLYRLALKVGQRLYAYGLLERGNKLGELGVKGMNKLLRSSELSDEDRVEYLYEIASYQLYNDRAEEAIQPLKEIVKVSGGGSVPHVMWAHDRLLTIASATGDRDGIESVNLSLRRWIDFKFSDIVSICYGNTALSRVDWHFGRLDDAVNRLTYLQSYLDKNEDELGVGLYRRMTEEVSGLLNEVLKYGDISQRIDVLERLRKFQRESEDFNYSRSYLHVSIQLAEAYCERNTNDDLSFSDSIINEVESSLNDREEEDRPLRHLLLAAKGYCLVSRILRAEGDVANEMVQEADRVLNEAISIGRDLPEDLAPSLSSALYSRAILLYLLGSGEAALECACEAKAIDLRRYGDPSHEEVRRDSLLISEIKRMMQG